uniref:Peptidase S54 rhomboid domain-containing protein n=1 Tax=viral metagenome TaxID=1070528 RepID=A0A6C0LWZ3_9ZZZZ
MDKVNKFKKIPVSVLISVSIIIIFSLYVTTALKQIPCGKDVMSIFYGNFVHVDIYHLLSNIYALYALSRVEVSIGYSKFIALVIFLLIFNTIIETVMYKIFKNLHCSIGFSGVLFGIAAWELVTSQDFDWVLITSLIVMVLGPTINNPNASFMGHLVGAISGIIGGLLWGKFA